MTFQGEANCQELPNFNVCHILYVLKSKSATLAFKFSPVDIMGLLRNALVNMNVLEPFLFLTPQHKIQETERPFKLVLGVEVLSRIS